MKPESFISTNKQVVGEARPVLDPDGQPMYIDTGSPILIVAYYKDDSKREIDQLCILNLGPGKAIIHRFALDHGENTIFSSDVYDIIEPGIETELLSAEIFSAWMASFSEVEQGSLENVLPSAGEGITHFTVSVRLSANGLRAILWPVQITRKMGRGERGFDDTFTILHTLEQRDLN